MTLIGKKLSIQLYHPDISEMMPKVEGLVLKVIEVKKFKLFGCIVKLSKPFDKSNFLQKDAKEITKPFQYAILSSERNNFNELMENKILNFGFSLIINTRILKINTDLWQRDDFKDYSFGNARLCKR